MKTYRIYSATHAEMLANRAGEKYRPSNGTEGEIFMAGWCAKCARDKAMREGEPFEECDDNERCDIIGRTFAHDVTEEEYPVEWQYGLDGQPCCTAFVEQGQPITQPRCQHTMDLFIDPGHPAGDMTAVATYLDGICVACGKVVPE